METGLSRAGCCKISVYTALLLLLSGCVAQQEADCSPNEWSLQKKNWTDGAPDQGELNMCTLLNPSSTNITLGPNENCRSTIAFPKVALLFLTMGEMRHEALWAMWFKQASMIVPKDCFAAALCQQQSTKSLVSEYKSCLSSGRNVLEQQVLFSVFTHPPPGFEGYNEDSLFFKSEIADRLDSMWGTFDLAQVARNLMQAALEDPLNQRFITVSESCIPLYSPSVVYHQLIYANKSRINACNTRENWGRDEYRWTFRLEEALGGRLKKEMWRKSHQWLGLTRKHARLTVADKEVAAVNYSLPFPGDNAGTAIHFRLSYPSITPCLWDNLPFIYFWGSSKAFAKHCYSGSDPDFGGWHRTCFSDEHYFATLLAFHGLDEETDCIGELTHTFWCSWCSGDERLHPKTYKADETDVALLRGLRQEERGCTVDAASDAAAQLMMHLADFDAQSKCQLPVNATAALLPLGCHLFARKFSNGSSAAAFHSVFSMMLVDDGRQKRRQEAVCNPNSTIAESSTEIQDLSLNLNRSLESGKSDTPEDPVSVGPKKGITRDDVIRTVQSVLGSKDKDNYAGARNGTRTKRRQARSRKRKKQGSRSL